MLELFLFSAFAIGGVDVDVDVNVQKTPTQKVEQKDVSQKCPIQKDVSQKCPIQKDVSQKCPTQKDVSQKGNSILKCPSQMCRKLRKCINEDACNIKVSSRGGPNVRLPGKYLILRHLRSHTRGNRSTKVRVSLRI